MRLIFGDEGVEGGNVVERAGDEFHLRFIGQQHGADHGRLGRLAPAHGVGDLALDQDQIAAIGLQAGTGTILEIAVEEQALGFEGIEQHGVSRGW